MICFFDLATQTGWATGDGSCDPRLGSVRMPSPSEPGQFLDFYERWVVQKLRSCIEVAGGPEKTMVAYESPTLPAGRIAFGKGKPRIEQQTSIQTLRKLYSMGPELEKVCIRLKLECREVAIGTIKKRLAGKGNAEKIDLQNAALRLLKLNKVPTADEADALGGWLEMVSLYRKPHWPAWEARLADVRKAGYL